jgi:pimeloyl-ACP methyl ester carboxylesterase
MMASPFAPRRLKRRRYVNHTLRRWGRKSENLPGPVRRRYWLDTRASTRARAGQLLHREWVTKELPAVLAGRYRSERLVTPTLALYGEDDPITPPRLFKGHERYADDLRVEGVPDAGHLLPEERPELVAERALEFFGA